MRVRDIVIGTRGDEQLPCVVLVVGERLGLIVEKECESALEPAGDVGMRPLPRPPLREGSNLRQVVAIGQFFEKQVGQRCGGLADGESRMPAALDHGDAPASLSEGERAQGAREPGAHDCDVHVDGERHEEGNDAEVCSQVEQDTSGR